jgi:ATP-binding cassette subfamily B protein/subfamily B ATP-binding cassette protein MsbA
VKTLRRCLVYFRPFWAKTLGALLLMGVSNALSVLRPWPLALLVDEVFGGSSGTRVFPEVASWIRAMSPENALAVLAGTVVMLQLAWGSFQFWHTWILVKIGLRALLQLRGELYGTLQGLSLKFHDNRRSGDSTFRVTYDTQSIQTVYNRGFVNILSSVISLVMMLGVMWACSWKLTLVALGVIPPLIWAIYYFAERVRQDSTAVQKEESDVLSRAQEGLASVRIVQAFGRQGHEVRRFLEECEESLSANLRLTFTNVSSSFIVSLITAVGTCALFYFGGHQVLTQEISLGTFVLFTSYLVMLYQPLEQLSYTGWAVAGAMAGAQRVFEVLDAPDDVPDRPNARVLTATPGPVEFDRVIFGYDPARPVLRELSVRVDSGSTAAFVGGTGAGKSTLLALAARFYDPQNGAIRLGGTDLREFTKQSLRANIGMVLQDTLLLSTTVRENIAYGKLDATDEEIREAARMAQAHEFIQRLPQGYDTPVGERGVLLSGGQRQRLGIARAFLKNAPILLLDEPTSALDVQTESEIMEAIDRLMVGRTTLIVTHRLATIHRADIIHVLDHGLIAESGNSQELIQRGGLYATLWRQAKGEGAQT